MSSRSSANAAKGEAKWELGKRRAAILLAGLGPQERSSVDGRGARIQETEGWNGERAGGPRIYTALGCVEKLRDASGQARPLQKEPLQASLVPRRSFYSDRNASHALAKAAGHQHVQHAPAGRCQGAAGSDHAKSAHFLLPGAHSFVDCMTGVLTPEMLCTVHIHRTMSRPLASPLANSLSPAPTATDVTASGCAAAADTAALPS